MTESETNQPLTRKQLKQLRREQGSREEQRSSRLRKAKLGFGAALILLSLTGGVSYFSGLDKKALAALNVENFPELPRKHVEQEDCKKDPKNCHEPYNSVPATSGEHYPAPAAAGVYKDPLPEETLVHNLEHGDVVLYYRFNGTKKEDIEKLEAIGKQYKAKVVVAPYEKNMDTPFAAVAWTRLMRLESVDEGKITEFIKRFKNRGPEFMPDM